MHAHAHTHAHMHMHTLSQLYTLSWLYTCMHTHCPVYMHAHVHKQVHACTYPRTGIDSYRKKLTFRYVVQCYITLFHFSAHVYTPIANTCTHVRVCVQGKCVIQMVKHKCMHTCMHTHMHNTCALWLYTHTCTYSCSHTPILQIWLLQLGRETLAILSRSAAGIDVVLKIFQEFQVGEIVVKIDMVVFSLQIWGVFTTLAPRPCSVVLFFFPV